MAGNDTAALVVALSAQLTKFEKDMKGAVDIADKRTKEIETRFAAMNGAITGKLEQLGAAASNQLGFAGTLLRTLGPAGIAAAVGIGAAVGGILALANATAEFSERAKRLKEGAETAGFTITQFKLLGQAGKTVGLDFDETAAFFTKFIANLEALRGGSGPLFDALLKIDTGLLRQLSTTKNNVEAVDILVAAFKRLEDQTKRLDLARAAGGRAGLSGVRLLDSLGDKGGLSGLQANSPAVDEGQIERAAKLRVEIDAIAKKTANIWGGMFSDTILQNQRDARLELQKIVEFIDRIVTGKQKISAPAADTFADRFGVFPQAGANKPPPPGTGGTPSVELAILQKNLALLGDAVTVGEQWRLKRLEIAAAAEKGGLSDGIAQRALSAFNVAMLAAAVATRERLGIATEEQIVHARLAQLAQDRAKFGLSENEVQKATVVILREAKQAADALTVRQAYLPGLKQLELDARNLRKGLDDTLVSGLNSVTDGLADMATGTKTAAQAFTDMTNSILRDIARLVIRQTITGPIAGAIGQGISGFTGIGGGGATDVNNGYVPTVGGGGVVPPGAPAPIVANSLAAPRGPSGPMSFTLINNGAPLQPEGVNMRSDREMEVFVRAAARDEIESEKTGNFLKSTFNLDPSMATRA